MSGRLAPAACVHASPRVRYLTSLSLASRRVPCPRSGRRQMRATALSDDRVIAAVNRHFVAVALNVTTQGFPVQDIPALKYAETVFQTNWRFEFGFANCLAVRGWPAQTAAPPHAP